jgi:hypothetical protein
MKLNLTMSVMASSLRGSLGGRGDSNEAAKVAGLSLIETTRLAVSAALAHQ